MSMPPDPFSGGEPDDFLPMAKSARKIYEAAIIAGFSESQAMEWMIRITSAMIAASFQAQQGKLDCCRIPLNMV